MTAKDARTAALAIDDHVNIIERVRDARATFPAVFILGRAYVTRSGKLSVEIKGAGQSWPAAIQDMIERKKAKG